jgi:ferric-dicitrate binding protein FerR (iron transport regulator)
MEMEMQDDSELERNMRAVFEADAESIERVIAAANRPRHRTMRLRVGATLAMAAIALIAVILWFQSPHVHAETTRLEYVGGVALLEFSDGSSLIVTPDSTDQGPQACLNLIFLEGDNP